MADGTRVADAISLHTVDGDIDTASYTDDVTDANSQSSAGADGDENAADTDEYLATPSAFLEATAAIETPPVYASRPGSPSRWSRLWSLIDLRSMFLLLFWTCLLLHESSVVRASRSSSTSDIDAAWHALLAASMSYGLAYIYNRKKDELSLLMPIRNDHPRVALAVAVSASVCIVGALVSMPVMRFTALDTKTIENRIDPGYRDLPCAKLASWEQALPNLEGSLPRQIHPPSEENVFADTIWNSTDHWMVSDKSNGTLRNLYAMNVFEMKEGGRGPGEKCWNGGDCVYEDGVYMPITPLTTEASASSLLGGHWQVESEVLGMNLRCELVEVDNHPELDRTEGTSSFSVNIKDSTGCSATAHLTPLAYNAHLRTAMQRTLNQFESRTSSPEAWKLLDYYRRLLLSNEEMVVYRPSWSTLDPGSGDCGHKLAIVGMDKAMISAKAKLTASHIQAAVCTPNFYTANVQLLLELNKTSRYHDQVVFQSRTRPAMFDDVRPYRKPIFEGIPAIGLPEFDLAFEPTWAKLNSHTQTQLSKLFLQHVSRTLISGSQWPFPQLREEMGDMIWKRPRALGTLLMCGRTLRLSFLTKLSAAAGLALEQRLEGADLGKDLISELHVFNAHSIQKHGITEDLLQARWTFRIFLYGSSIVLTAILVRLLAPESEIMSNGCSVFPWDITSVAARAAMLCHSPVRKWLSYYGTSELPDGMLKSMRIGYWQVHKLQGKSGWRVDYPQANIPVVRGSQKDENIKSCQDDLALYYMVRSSYHTGVALVIFLVAPWLTRTWTRPVEGKNQLVGLMQVAEFRLPASVWSIVVGKILPNSTLLFVCFMWLPGLYHFLRRRQPWITLKVPQPSHKSITLDYQNVHFPILRAIKSRHWFLVVLAIASALSLIAPVKHATLHQWQVVIHSAKPLQVPRHWEWAEKIEDPGAEVESLSIDALGNLADVLLSSRMLPPFSSPNISIVGIDYGKVEHDMSSPFASFETSALRASLECEEVNVNVTLREVPGAQSPLSRVQSYFLDEKNGQMRIETPCSSSFRFHAQDFTNAEDKLDRVDNAIECIRWWLDESASDNRVPRWLIVSSYGLGHWSSRHQDLLFAEGVSTTSQYCTPRIQIESGKATMQFQGGFFEKTCLVNYEASDKPTAQINQNIMATISKGLNRSNMALDGNTNGIVADEELIHTEFFAGDMLGYLMYRFACQGTVPCATRPGFSQDISQMFATYVSILAGRSNMLRASIPSKMVDLHPTQLMEITRTDTLSRVYLILFILLCAGIAAKSVMLTKHYSLPVSPEHLVVGLQLLSCSSIVDTLEKEVPDAAKLSLSELYEKVDSCTENHSFKLGSMRIDRETTYVIDVVDMFDDATDGEERYRD